MKKLDEKIKVESNGAGAKFAAWLARGDAIGVFQNADLGHPGVGHLIFMPLTPEEQARSVVGTTRAPDGFYGFGWRYVLHTIERTIDSFEFIYTPPPGNCVSCGGPLNVTTDYHDVGGHWDSECRPCRTDAADEDD